MVRSGLCVSTLVEILLVTPAMMLFSFLKAAASMEMRQTLGMYHCISIIVRETDLERATKAAHTAFQLDADQIEAVVYGGSGR